MTERETDYDPERVVVRDRRRIDPLTGAARAAADVPPPAGEPASEPVPGEPEPAPDSRVAELTADLQRVSAEYANYRKRVQRDQGLQAEVLAAGFAVRLLPLLDDVDRARSHGDLEGAFKVVGEALEAVVTGLGVERYGMAGDAFDPNVHEAVMTAPEDPTATAPVCAEVFSPGYRTASGRVLRPAKVVVAEPGPASQEA